MDLLLGQDTAGKVLLGDEELLRERVNQGDDITLFVESRTYSEYLTFSNFLVLPSGVVGLSLQHTQPARNVRRPMSVFMLYDSTNKVVFCRQELNNGVFRSSGTDKPNAYQTYTWYSTRAYNASDESLDSLLLLGNTLKVRVILNEDTCLIIKPEIIYFPYQEFRTL